MFGFAAALTSPLDRDSLATTQANLRQAGLELDPQSQHQHVVVLDLTPPQEAQLLYRVGPS
jgi:hypothetical protein